MKLRVLLCGILVLLTTPVVTRTGERLAIRVSPSVALAPADLTVRTTIESNASNRTLVIIAESDDFYRSSEIPLDGAKAPRTTSLAFRSLPGGVYSVRAVLKGANDEWLAQTRQALTVSSATER